MNIKRWVKEYEKRRREEVLCVVAFQEVVESLEHCRKMNEIVVETKSEKKKKKYVDKYLYINNYTFVTIYISKSSC